jgi:hypothetical protein
LAALIILIVIFLFLLLAQNQALNLNLVAKMMTGVIVLVYAIATI